MKKVHLFIIGVILFNLLAVQPSHMAEAQSASTIKWSINAMSCVPNGTTTQNNMVQTSNGNARFTAGKTGDIYLICPFSDGSLNGSTVTTIEMTLQSSGNIKASAVLRKVLKLSGNVSNLLGVSRGPSCLGSSIYPYYTCTKISSLSTLDFDNYYYYVQVSLHRDSSGDDVRILGVTIY